MSIVYRTTVGVRRVLTRRPWVYWVVVVALAALLAASTQANLTEVRRVRDSWGDSTTVWVATSDIAPGQPVAGRVTLRQFATAMVPEDAVVAAEILGVARQQISPGEVITTFDLTAKDDQLALVPAGWVAVVVSESPRSGAAVGSKVRLAADGVVIAGEALVIGDVDGATLVAVPEAVAPLVPVAAASGALSLLRVP